MKMTLKSAGSRWNIALKAAVVMVLAMTLPQSAHGHDAAPTTLPAGRTPEAINADIRIEYGTIEKLMSDPSTMIDAAKRSAAAPKVIPVLKKLIADYSELEVADPFVKEEIARTQSEYLVFLSLMGDGDSTDQLQIQADSKMYADYHHKGLEVIGISNDQSGDDLMKIRADNKVAPWPQL